MEKKYQVFVSSTFEDLKDERQEIIQALLELRAIPIGMELFPAANDEQWTLIKRSIDDCDYYIVVVAGRYGSIGPDGLSYTEMEYRYAQEQGKPVIGFIHEAPDQLPVVRCEDDPIKRQKLDSFRKLVQTKMCKKWSNPSDLGGKVSRSLVNLMNDYPAVGWIRGDMALQDSAAKEILKLNKKIEALTEQLTTLSSKPPVGVESLAQGVDRLEVLMAFKVHAAEIEFPRREQYVIENINITVTWDDMFAYISPHFAIGIDFDSFKKIIRKFLSEKTKDELDRINAYEGKRFSAIDVKTTNSFSMIVMQFKALGLITNVNMVGDSSGSIENIWKLTPYGDRHMVNLLAIKRK